MVCLGNKGQSVWILDELKTAPYLLGMALMIAFDALTPFLNSTALLFDLNSLALAEYVRAFVYLIAAIAANPVEKLFHNKKCLSFMCLTCSLGVLLMELAALIPNVTLSTLSYAFGIFGVSVFWCAGMLKFYELFTSVSLSTTIIIFTTCHLIGSGFASLTVLVNCEILAVGALFLIPLIMFMLGARHKEIFTQSAKQDIEETVQKPSIPMRPLALMLVTLFVTAFVRSRIPSQLEPESYSGALACALLLFAIMLVKRRAVHLRTLYNITPFLLMCGLLLFTASTIPTLVASGALVNGGYLAFDVLVTAILCNISRRYGISTYWLFGFLGAISRFAYEMGTLFGKELAKQPGSVVSFTAFAAAIIIAVAFAFLLTEQDFRTSWGVVKEELGQPSVSMYYHSLSETCAAIAEEYSLTRREEDVLLLLAQRKTIPDVEKELYISNSTAKTHCKNIYRKLKVHKREELLSRLGHPSTVHDDLKKRFET